MKLKKYTFFILLAVLAVGTVFFVAKSLKLKKELALTKEQNQTLTKKLESHEQLVKIDSLLLEGDYDGAIASYQTNLLTAGKENNMVIPLRIALAEKLRNKDISLNTAVVDETEKQDSLPVSRWSEETAIRTYDSLNFSLEKTKVQLARLKKQLQQKSYGEYLTFTSQKGNQLHYIGQVKNGKAHGFGVALLETGSRYEGEWENNQRHGEGTFYWPDGEYYVGTYQNDKRSGYGTYYWPNGEKYTGQWKDDKRSGTGKFYDAEGEIVAGGEWSDDKLVEVNEK
ncbi:MORN repeat-containing protein [Flagellimonas sp.]|uniref:MORN repeat-containing protein n=1 Tax=Flagellimonas sp. TaxID=2058762 RepID=UPI003BACF6F1